MRLMLFGLLILFGLCLSMGEKPVDYEKYVYTKESERAYSYFQSVLKEYLVRMENAEKTVLSKNNISQYNKETMLSDYAEEITNIKEFTGLTVADYYEKVYKIERFSVNDKLLRISNKDFLQYLKEKTEFYKK